MINDQFNKNSEFKQPFRFYISAPENLIIQLFDLGKLFLDKKMVTFTAKGRCMYPLIRQGDNIYIQPKRFAEIQIGEVAVYRRNERLFSHRVIAKGIDADRAYLITRPDTAQAGSDGPIFNDDLLGVVTKVERKGKSVNFSKRDQNSIEKIRLGFCFRYLSFKFFFLEKAGFFAVFLQQFKLYRLLAGTFSQRLNQNSTFIFSVPAHGRVTDRFYRKVSEEELAQLIFAQQDSVLLKWAVTLKINRQESAALTLILKPGSSEFSGCWLASAAIRIKHRGTDIEKTLLNKVDGLLKQAKVSEIFASVLPKSKLERMFLQGLGFKPVAENIVRRKLS